MIRRLLPTLVLFGGLLACVRTQPALAYPTSCQLMTPSDVGAVLHVTVKSGYRGSPAEGEGDLCVYGGVASLIVLHTNLTKYNAIIQNQAQLGPVTSVPGLGEKAAFTTTGQNKLVVYAKGFIVEVWVSTAAGRTRDAAMSAAKEFARLALSRL